MKVLYALAAAAALVVPMRAEIIEQVLVKVNGDIITKTELEQRQIAVLRQKNPNLRANDEAALRQALAEVTPEVIADAVDELLVVQRGRELGLERRLLLLDRRLDSAPLDEVLRLDDRHHFDRALGLGGAPRGEAQRGARLGAVVDHYEIGACHRSPRWERRCAKAAGHASQAAFRPPPP